MNVSFGFPDPFRFTAVILNIALCHLPGKLSFGNVKSRIGQTFSNADNPNSQ